MSGHQINITNVCLSEISCVYAPIFSPIIITISNQGMWSLIYDFAQLCSTLKSHWQESFSWSMSEWTEDIFMDRLSHYHKNYPVITDLRVPSAVKSNTLISLRVAWRHQKNPTRLTETWQIWSSFSTETICPCFLAQIQTNEGWFISLRGSRPQNLPSQNSSAATARWSMKHVIRFGEESMFVA